MVFSPICGEMAMDMLWGNANIIKVDMLWGNGNGHFAGKCRWTFCGQMPMDILWANANSHVNYSLLPFNHALNRSGACS